MEQQTTVRITRSTISSGRPSNHGRDSSTQAPILKISSQRQIPLPETVLCDCADHERKHEQKPDQCKINQNPPRGYGIPSQNSGFQVPPNVNQMPFNQTRFSCPCPENEAPGTPPTNDELWDLQFCRWWGWNWIRKREEMMNKKPCESVPKRTCSCQIDQSKQKKHPHKKRDFFGWCNDVFRSNKKRPCIDVEERKRLNDLYDTPSCSTNDCVCPVDDWECRSLDFKGEYSCYCNSAGKTTSRSTIVIKNKKCRNLKKCRSVICEKMDSTTSEECCVPCKSCSGESSDYVTLRLKCAKSECGDKLPCECGLRRNRNVCPCKIQLCEQPKCVCSKPVCCEPVCRPKKMKSSPFVCLPSRRPPPPCKPTPFLCQKYDQPQQPCCVPKLCNPAPPCKYRFPRYIRRCPQQNVGCIVPKKEYVVCCRQKCRKPKKCCCCCCCCCCRNQLKLVGHSNKCEGTSRTGSGKQSDASDSTKSTSANQHSPKGDGNCKPRKGNNPGTKSSVSSSLQNNKYVSPLSGRNYALNPKTVTVSPVITKSKLPPPIDTNDAAFNFAAISDSPGDWEHIKLLQAVCDAIMSARSPYAETSTLPEDPIVNRHIPEKLPQSMGDSKLIEEKQSSSFKENTFLNSLLDTLDDKYFSNLEKNFPKFTPLTSLPEEESVDLQCESSSCGLDETSKQEPNKNVIINNEPGSSTLSRSLIPFNPPRAWLTAPKLPNSESATGLMSSVPEKQPETRQDSPNVYDILFSTIEPNFEPTHSKMYSPKSHALLLHEIPSPNVNELTQTSNFVSENEKGLNSSDEAKPRKSKIPVLVNRENGKMRQLSSRSTVIDLGIVKEEEDETEISSDFLDKKYSTILKNVQSNVPVFSAPNLTDIRTNFSKIMSGISDTSSKEVLESMQNLASNSFGFNPISQASLSNSFGTNVIPIPTTSHNAGTSPLKMNYRQLRSKENFRLGDDVVTSKSMKRESPFSMFCKPVKSSSIIKLLPTSTKRSFLSRPEKFLLINRSDRSEK